MPDGSRDRRFKVEKVDGLHQEIEGVSVHRGADVGDVAIGGHNDGGELIVGILKL